MINKKIFKSSIMNKILKSHIGLVSSILFIVICFSLYFNMRYLNNNIKENILNLSYILSEDTRIKDVLNNGSNGIDTYLDKVIEKYSYIDIITICDNEGVRIYHPMEEKIGGYFSGGDEKDILNGKDPYVVNGIGSEAYQLRAFNSIKDDNENILGFVMVSAYTATIKDIKKQVIYQCLIIFICALIIGIILSYVLSRNIKKSLLGYEPDQLTKLYLQKEEILNSLEEGIVVIDTKGNCTLSNLSAEQILKESNENTYEIMLFIKKHLIQVIKDKKAKYNEEINIMGKVILMNKIPIIDNGKLIGAIALLRNKTEVTELAEQLTGVNHIIAALRATTHEYMNKLHAILGLLQIGETKQAMEYIMTVQGEEEDEYRGIIKKIKNPTIAGLILGKMNRAKELNINMYLQKESYLDRHNDFLSTRDLVTIIGNLIENAIDAVKDKEDIREIGLEIKADNDMLTIIVDDTGFGINEEEKKEIFTRGFSTKGENRGIGLSLVQQIVILRDGVITVESEVYIGTIFTIIIHKKRND